MFKCDCRKLQLSFNEFHAVKAGDMPDHGDFCLIELKDGRHTAGTWYPQDYNDLNSIAGEFIRGTADSVAIEEVAKWHALRCYNLTNCLKDETVSYINIGAEKEGSCTVKFKEFKSLLEYNISPCKTILIIKT